jgi:hypothetical protein
VAGPVSTRELARLIRGSRALDGSLKRHWLRVLAHLTPTDRERLAEILRRADAGTVSPAERPSRGE